MFSIIVNLSKNNCIGKNNDLLFHISKDLKRFKEITSNHKIIMGRKCFLSLLKVLPNRKTIIATKNKDYKVDHEDVSMCYDLDKFIEENKDTDEEIFVIGGGEIYKYFLPFCKKLYLTHIDKIQDGDVFFPNINYEMYNKVFESENFYDEKEDVFYKFSDYEILNKS